MIEITNVGYALTTVYARCFYEVPSCAQDPPVSCRAIIMCGFTTEKLSK